MPPGLSCSRAISEVVGDADYRVVDVVVDVGAQFVAREVEGWRLDDEAAIFGANVEAGADLVGDTSAIQATDVGVLADAGQQLVGSGVVNGREDQARDAGFDEGIEVLVAEAV